MFAVDNHCIIEVLDTNLYDLFECLSKRLCDVNVSFDVNEGAVVTNFMYH